MHTKLTEIIGINKVNMQTPVFCTERYFQQYISLSEEFILKRIRAGSAGKGGWLTVFHRIAEKG